MRRNIEITDHTILSAFKHMGYNKMSAIDELLDNSIDAKSTLIEISYNKLDRTLTIKDNGKGMSYEHLQNAFNIGFKRMYESNEIGNFGIGLNTGCLNLMDMNYVDTSTIIITSDGIEKSILTWQPKLKGALVYDIVPTVPTSSKGTTIIINDVQPINTTTLRKHLSVVFYPTLKNGIVKIFLDGVEIIGLDPLYRDSELTETEHTIATIKGQNIDIFATSINKNQKKHSWDRESKDGEWASSNGGIYAIYGSRYIEYGGSYPTRYKNPWDSRTRMEFTIPKNLTEEFDIHLNKTQSVNFHNNENIEDVLRKLKDMLNWGQRTRGRRDKNKKETTDNVVDNMIDNQFIIDTITNPNINIYLKQGIVGNLGKNIKLDLNIKAEEMLASLSANNPQGYGARVPQFIIENTSLTLSPPSKNEGDAILYSDSTKYCLLKNTYITETTRKIAEIKVSYPDNKTNSTFAILRTKPTQKIDYYIVCLVDVIIPEGEKYPVNYIGHFYVLPAAYIDESPDFKRTPAMGTKEANQGNANVELRFTIDKQEAFEKFGKYNIARGTSFFDLKECIDYLNNGTNPKLTETKKTKSKCKTELV